MLPVYFLCRSLDNTKYIGRSYNTAITSDQSSWHVYVGTYSGSKASSGIKIYRDGTQVDNTDVNSGVYAGMSNGTAQVGSFAYFVGSWTFANARFGSSIIINKELTAEEVKRVSQRLLSYAGTFQ